MSQSKCETIRATELSQRALRRLATTTRRYPFEAVVSVVSAAYFALALSPSSYGYALKNFFGVGDSGTYLGSPRIERWDEWAVQTPFVQALVRNDFGLHNATSFYGESFRNLITLPLMDWGMIFRPLHWGYLVLPAPWAYSLTWTLSAWLCLVGFSLLLRRCGLGYLTAVAVTLTIFLTPFTQAWWTSIAPMLAFFPWILLLASSRVRLRFAVPLMVWLIGCWIVSAAYLPGLVILSLVALTLVTAFFLRRSEVGRLAVLSGAAVAGAAVGIVYLFPVLRALASTVYPGHRVIAGGDLPFAQWFAQFNPLGVTRGYSSTLPSRLSSSSSPSVTILPEAVAIGSWLPLLALALVDYRRLRRDLTWTLLRPVVVLVGAFGLLTAWQIFDMTHFLGAMLGWNRSSEQRTLIASGLLLVIASGWVLSRFPIRVTAVRVAGFVGLVLTATAVAAAVNENDSLAFWSLARDNVIVIAASLGLILLGALGLIAGRLRATPRQLTGGLALVAVLPVAATWAFYNPVQDSRAIFAPLDTAMSRSLDELATRRSDGAIAVNSPGAILNGQGYRSVVHVLPIPQLATFAALFPNVEPAKRNEIFNRYAEYYLIFPDGEEPMVQGDGLVGLPANVIRRLASLPDP